MVSHLDECERCRRALETLAEGGEPWLAVARGLGDEPPVPSPSWAEATPGRTRAATRQPSWTGPALDAARLGRRRGLARAGWIITRFARSSARAAWAWSSRASTRSSSAKLRSKCCRPYWAARGQARERFLREARAAAAIRDEHVVAVYAVEECRGLPYLVMEYITGGSLQERLDRGELLSIEEVVRIGREIALGLAAAHAHGLIHRDIKPANILLDGAARRVKITDFGLARAADDASLTQDGIVVGTPQFMAPERRAASRSTRGRICSAWAACSIASAPAGSHSPKTGRWRSCAAYPRMSRPRFGRSTPRSPSGWPA